MLRGMKVAAVSDTATNISCTGAVGTAREPVTDVPVTVGVVVFCMVLSMGDRCSMVYRLMLKHIVAGCQL